MSTHVMTNELIYNAFILGAKNVIHEKNNLNAINVFPVADGDTGTNLASMMSSIIENARLKDTPKETLQSIADAAIIGARGNSGLIFAEYINGFAENDDDIQTVEGFISSAKRAFENAAKAVAKPVEGTILTLMRAFSNALESLHRLSQSFLDMMINAYESLKGELQRTPDLLPVLKENKVVDAGAKGFLHFVEGFIKALKGEKADIEEEEETVPVTIHVDHLEEGQTRYCTEALIKGDSIDMRGVRALLESMGDSIVIAGNQRTMRIHIHTDRPADVFRSLDDYGRIVEQKVDDMKIQFEIANHKKHSVALVTDSIADLPKELIDQNQIVMFPLNIHMKDSIYKDKITIESNHFYEMMDTLDVYPTSSQPNTKDVENLYSYLSTHYKDILVLSVSSKMSGTHQVFKSVSEKFKNTNIQVIDTQQNSGAEGLLVMKAAELINKGYQINEVVDAINTLKKRAKILVSVKTLKYMVRSGRVKKVTGLIGKILNLKPVISIDDEGNGIIFDKSFSLKKSDTLIQKHIEKVMDDSGIDTYAIVHANAPERAAAYAKTYEAITGLKPAYIMDISTIVAMSAGVGTVAVAYIRKGE
ncbi:MAG: DegV family EDD domain-containing protein [Acholeplasmataceae bacterium]|nr:DegV family EDD domain-containing protein [Acholeplasmataceae bacterium]